MTGEFNDTEQNNKLAAAVKGTGHDLLTQWRLPGSEEGDDGGLKWIDAPGRPAQDAIPSAQQKYFNLDYQLQVLVKDFPNKDRACDTGVLKAQFRITRGAISNPTVTRTWGMKTPLTDGRPITDPAISGAPDVTKDCR